MSAGSYSHAWRALRHRNFRLFFVGQGISQLGNWMTRLATAWLVYRLTDSALLLGAVAFAGQVPTFLLAPFAGVWIENIDRRKLLVWTQCAAAVQSMVLAVLTLSGVITFPEVLALAVMQGVINAFDMPGRQSSLVMMVEDRADLGNAIAINSSMVNGTRLLGPAVAGVVIGLVGEGWCFLIDSVSYIAVLASLFMMRLPAVRRPEVKTGMAEQLREGWRYVTTFRPVRTILILFAVSSLFGYSCIVLLPLFADRILHGGPDTLGWLMGALGIGAFVSSASLAVRKTVLGLTRWLLISITMLGASLLCLGLSRSLWPSLFIMLFVGFGMTQVMAVSNTIIQTLVPDARRARVMSYYTMTFFGMMPLGSLLNGALAHWMGAAETVLVTGTLCLAGAVWFLFERPKVREAMRPVYEELGLLSRPPEH